MAQALEENPKPFTWHKNADETLDRLAGYRTAIEKWSPDLAHGTTRLPS
jgi:hypothetical protein